MYFKTLLTVGTLAVFLTGCNSNSAKTAGEPKQTSLTQSAKKAMINTKSSSCCLPNYKQAPIKECAKSTRVVNAPATCLECGSYSVTIRSKSTCSK